MEGTDLETMIDSGAYSALSKGKRINLDDYVDFILKRTGADCWTTAVPGVSVVNLDVIPGTKGGPQPTPAECERAAEEGWNNRVRV